MTEPKQGDDLKEGALMTAVEIASVRAHPGRGDDLESALSRGAAIIDGDFRCHGTKIHRGIERPDDFILSIVWDSVEAHAAFRDSPEFQAYRAEVAGPLDEVLGFAHYREVATP
jgi:quinol monooxygenase YgiN